MALVYFTECLEHGHMQMNASKTELIFFGGKKQLEKCNTTQIHVNGEVVKRSNIIRVLGANLDEKLSLRQHVTMKCQN